MVLSRSLHCSMTPLSPKNPTEGFLGASGAQEGRSKKENQISGLQKVLLVHSRMRITPQHGSVKAVVLEETRGVSPWSKTLVPRKPIEHAQELGFLINISISKLMAGAFLAQT